MTTSPTHVEGVEPPVRRPGGRRRTPAGRAILVSFLALALAALMNGESLHRVAERQPYGFPRDVAVAVTGVTRSVGETLGLHLPRRGLEALTGRTDPVAGSEFGADVAVTPAPTVPTLPPPADPGGAPAPTISPPAEPQLVPHRTPTAEDPLRVLFAGDSLIGNVSIGFGRAFRDEPRITASVEVQVATGLARPDVLDWPAHLVALLDLHDPEVLVLVFGANDDQDMESPDGRVSLLGPGWLEEYARRVGIMMDLASAEGRTVLWLGIPAVTRPGLEEARQAINHVAMVEAQRRPGVEFVDLSEVLSPGGAFVQDLDGQRVREGDGVHLTIAGGELAATMIHEVIVAVRDLSA